MTTVDDAFGILAVPPPTPTPTKTTKKKPTTREGQTNYVLVHLVDVQQQDLGDGLLVPRREALEQLRLAAPRLALLLRGDGVEANLLFTRMHTRGQTTFISQPGW